MSAVEWEDAVIRPRAYARAGGDSVANWFAALQELRQAYADHYLPALAKRFGFWGPQPAGR
jgi:hypothetical protein